MPDRIRTTANRVVAIMLAIVLAGFASAQDGGEDQQTIQERFPQLPADAEQVARPGQEGDVAGDTQIQLVRVTGGLVDPVNVVSPGDGSGRQFVVERHGRIVIVQDGQVLEEPFLDVSGSTLSAFLEQGLYDVAFHPDFAENGRFFVHFAELLRNGDSVIVEYSVSDDDPNVADPDSAQLIMQIDQPWANHNGGELAFGPDGYLYIGSGDGGWEGDPIGAGQDLSTLLGKILRIDVDVPDSSFENYAIPADNPFADKEGLVRLFGLDEAFFAQLHSEARPEIWAYGLRNPWKFSFDPQNGDMYVAEVGQNVWEEVDLIPAGAAGLNLGWDFKMGTHCFPVSAAECADVGVLPIAEYSHEQGDCAVIGIGVYRGEAASQLDGLYFFGDYCSGKVWATARNDDGAWNMEQLLDTQLQLTGSGRDEAGELYVTSCECNYGGSDPQENPPGALWRLVTAEQVPEGATTAPTGGGQEE